jgi:hypothetical protein
LAKRCRSVDVPIPYRGYWARKATGQDPADWAAVMLSMRNRTD